MEKLSSREINGRIYRYSVKINQYFKDTISEVMANTARQLDIESNVRFSHYFILCELYHAEAPLYLTTIAEAVNVKLPNVSNLVNELIRYGLVEKCSSSENKRIVLVQLSKKGREYSDILIPQILKVHANTFGSEEEAAAGYHYYKKIYDRLFHPED